MRISIVLAAYNGASYIEEQLDSLRKQSRPADEVIIRDDCSTDETYSISERYIARNRLDWTLLRAEKNGGYRENFRQCIALATGDWLLLCDQDDIWAPNKLERFEQIIERHPDAAAVVSGFRAIDAKGAPLPLPDAPGTANHGLIPFALPAGVSPLRLRSAHPELLLTQSIAMGCCMGFARPVCERYLRLTRCGFPHDWEFALVASYAGEIYYTDEALIDYRLHGKNAIGLPGLFPQNGPKRPSRQGRLRVMDEFDGLLDSAQRILSDMGEKPLSPRYARYAALRRRAVASRSLVSWLALHRYYDIYSRMFTLKQRLGDLYVILRGNTD
ncbi:MAG: glycosyltransferase family 2 protein [Eubacteriales bacterium]|nr:glycosyltransferase family 2 protein [Eubacteriales bacterium]